MLRLSLAFVLSLGVSAQVSAQGSLSKQPNPTRSTKTMLAVAIDPAEDLAPTPSKAALASPLLADDYEPASQDGASLLDFYKAEVDHLEDGDSPATLREEARTPNAEAAMMVLPTAPLGRRRYRTRLVRTGRWSAHREAVESLTCTDTGPLVLALLPATSTAPAQVLAGPGYDQTVPLRPLELTQEAVLRLCGDHAAQVRAYAMVHNLRFEQTNDVARLLDYYNRLAVVTQ
jgi:hypothetical protein